MNDDFVTTPHLPISNTGVLWDLDDAVFLRWWRALPQIDRDEFSRMYEGDELLARFVCALHYMESAQNTALNPGVIVSAYAIAAHLRPSEPETRIRAAKAWRSDPVQVLWGRLHQRSAEQAKTRILNSVSYLLERAIADATESGDYKERALVASAAIKFAALIEAREAEDRAATRRRGEHNLKTLTDKEIAGHVEAPDEAEAKIYLRMLRKELGPKFDVLVTETTGE
jgi:hypothetical protein